MSTDKQNNAPDCPFPCGWQGLHKIAVQDAAYLAKVQWPEDEEGVSVPRATAMRCGDYLIQVCRTMLNAAPVAAQAQKSAISADWRFVEARECSSCGHVGINDSSSDNAACSECDWIGPMPEKDRCQGCERESVMTAACPKCGERYNLLASATIQAPAQPTIKESLTVEQPVSGADGLADYPTHGMNLGQRIAHVGGRENAQGYVEFGSPMAVHALIQHVLRDFHRQGRVNLDPTQQDATLHAEVLDMVRMLEANEWADHCGKSELGQRLEWAITALQNQPQNIPEIIPESAKLDADKVQADLLNSLVEIVDAVIASDEEGLIEHSETIIKARAAIDAARKEAAHG